MNPEKIIKYSVPVFVLAIVSRAIVEISFIYYAVPVMCVFFIVLLFISSKFNSLPRIYFGVHHSKPNSHSGEDKQSEMSPESGIRHPVSSIRYLVFLIPGLWFLLTSLWSSYPEVSAARALYFILISAGSISAGFLWLRYSGKGLLDFLLPANIFIVLLCLFSIFTNIPSDSWTGGHGKAFMGFFGHQNLLASVLLFTLPAVLGLKIKDKGIKIKFFYFFLFTLNFILLLLTYSRSAILSFIFGVVVFLLLNKNWKIISYSFITAAVLATIIYLSPSLNQFADKVIKKDFPEFYSSRMWMWEPSYKAALEGGLTGLGYGISHPEIRSGEYSDHFENGRLIREKGNSSLALIEESGIIGMLLFLIPIFILLKYVCINVWMYETRNRANIQSYNHTILLSALIAFILHAQFEAWWVGVGSVQLPLFFIYLGLLTQYRRIKFK